MNWTGFTDYLKNNILQAKEHTTQTEYELREGIAEKYKITDDDDLEELISELGQLLISHEQRFDSEDNFHKLPEIEKEEESDNEDDAELKTWKELFPKREGTFFGKANNDESPSEEVFTILEKIYEDWQKQDQKEKELTKKAKEWEAKAEKLMKEWVSQQATKFFKEKGLSVVADLKKWLTDYESLSKEKKKELVEEHKKIKETVEFLGGEVGKEEKVVPPKWYNNIPWMKVIWYGAGGLLVILVLGWLKSKLKK